LVLDLSVRAPDVLRAATSELRMAYEEAKAVTSRRMTMVRAM
jgi:hypothetical protein